MPKTFQPSKTLVKSHHVCFCVQIRARLYDFHNEEHIKIVYESILTIYSDCIYFFFLSILMHKMKYFNNAHTQRLFSTCTFISFCFEFLCSFYTFSSSFFLSLVLFILLFQTDKSLFCLSFGILRPYHRIFQFLFTTQNQLPYAKEIQKLYARSFTI